MSDSVKVERRDGVARIAVDDGKANALSPVLIGALNAALDGVEKDAAAVVLSGRAGRFCGGFDLSVMRQGGRAAIDLVGAGAELCLRLLEFPKPVVVACGGHAIAAGALLVLSCDWRIGVRGEFEIGLNEVGIGMTLPHFAREIARERLARHHLGRAAVLAELYAPEAALEAGYFDELSEQGALLAAAHAAANRLAKLDARAFAHTKRALRADVVAAIRSNLDRDLGRELGGA